MAWKVQCSVSYSCLLGAGAGPEECLVPTCVGWDHPLRRELHFELTPAARRGLPALPASTLLPVPAITKDCIDISAHSGTEIIFVTGSAQLHRSVLCHAA